MKKRMPPVSTVLPKDAREALIEASQITNQRERWRAIEAATERAQWRYPHLFNQEGVTP